jgi:hypothetical protein
MTHHDAQLSESLDYLVAAHQTGQPLPPVPAELADEAALARQLLALAETMQPGEMDIPILFAQPDFLPRNGSRPLQISPSVPGHGRQLPRNNPNLRRVALPALLLVAIVSMILVNPTVRALAQDVLQLFQRSESDLIEVRLSPIASTAAPAATFSPATDTASVLATQATAMPEAKTVEASTAVPPSTLDSNFPLTLGEAAVEAGFPIRTPADLPAGFEFRGARFDANRQAVEQYFVFVGQTTGPVLTAQFILAQQPGAFDSLIGPSAAIDPVTVGDWPGEYVAGGWLYKPSGTQVESDGTVVQQFSWEQTLVPLQTLRWAEDGYFFEIAFIGSDTQAGYLVRDDLVSIASSLR